MGERLNPFGYVPCGAETIYKIINRSKRNVGVFSYPCRKYQSHCKNGEKNKDKCKLFPGVKRVQMFNRMLTRVQGRSSLKK